LTVIAGGFNKHARPVKATEVATQQPAKAPDDVADDFVIPVDVNLPG
jgi:hypothetical protein